MYYYPMRESRTSDRMSKTTSSRAERAKLRESQILAAAKHCFSRVGFHSTSMAQIATQAQMSVGQIYRHFPSKESLIEGIVREDVSRQLSLLNDASEQTVVEMVAPSNKKDIVDAAGSHHLALMLEISAEAARNPRVRDILLSNQRRAHAALKRRIQSEHPAALSSHELDVRARMIAAIPQGVFMQILLDPKAPTAALLKRLKFLTEQLLTFEPSD
jgi:AcrR family transcriptional regulator